MLWQKYYFDYDKINRRTTFGKIYHRYTLLKQTLLHVDKFKECSLTASKSVKVSAPSIEESPVNIECRVKQVIKTGGTHDIFIAEVVSVSVDEKYFDETGKFHFEKTKPICYSHGEYYGLGKALGSFGYSIMKKKTKIKKNSKGRKRVFKSDTNR